MNTIDKVLMVTLIFVMTGCASTGARQGQVERITPEELTKLLPPPVATLSLNEIVIDTNAGKTADEIIAKIKASNSRYELTASQVLDLNKQGVDIKVLDYIQQSNELAKQNAIADEMNKREKNNQAKQAQLRQQRNMDMRYYDPFWGPSFGGFYGRPYFGPIGPAGRFYRGNRFGWGLNYGYPYGW